MYRYFNFMRELGWLSTEGTVTDYIVAVVIPAVVIMIVYVTVIYLLGRI